VTLCARLGIIPSRFSPRQIRREPAEVVRLIRDVLERASSVPCFSSAPSLDHPLPGESRSG